MFLSPLVSITFDGSGSGVFFDRSNPNPGTPGSGPGADFAFGPLLSGVDQSLIRVTYSSAIAVGTSAPQGDLFAKLSIDFSRLPGGGLPPQDFVFTQDTDRAGVPEPLTAALSAAGIALLAFLRRFAA